jgi:hypothetical protein
MGIVRDEDLYQILTQIGCYIMICCCNKYKFSNKKIEELDIDLAHKSINRKVTFLLCKTKKRTNQGIFWQIFFFYMTKNQKKLLLLLYKTTIIALCEAKAVYNLGTKLQWLPYQKMILAIRKKMIIWITNI